MAVLGFFGAAGCSIFDQALSLLGTRTEELRDAVRDEPQLDKLIVFVHGFNSDRDKAWGLFPALLKDDDNFKDFNIHRFGYPTKGCRQVNDIDNLGEYLASYLTSIFKSTKPKYREVVLVGHSMGGLVILHALLNLERENFKLLKDQDVRVLTFGTPYYGVENTNLLLLFCENKQANDMIVLNDKLGKLAREWTKRFNQTPSPGGRGDTPQVPLYAFRGVEDRLVTITSACGYPQIPCEVVDGDHVSIVKPINHRHLTYKKLEELTTQPRVPRTAIGKIGIWVARLTGDEASHAAQRSIARDLEFYITQENPQLQAAVEVRELPANIAGNSLEEKEAEAKRLGRDQHASILVWGEVTRFAGVEEVHPRVTLINTQKPTKTAILAPVSQASLHPPLGTPPETVSVPPQRIQEPLQLARFVLAATFMERQAWTEAARQLDQIIAAGLSKAIRSADIYFYAGLAHQKVFKASGVLEALDSARDAYKNAVPGYEKEKDWNRYAGVQSNLGLIYTMLAKRGVEPEKNFENAITALTEAADRLKEQPGHTIIQSNLGVIYGMSAERGFNPIQNLEHAITALTEAARWFKEHSYWADYARVSLNLGSAQETRAAEGPHRGMSLEAARVAFEEALIFFARTQRKEEEAVAAMGLKRVLQLLIAQGIDIEQNQARMTRLNDAKYEVPLMAPGSVYH